MDYGEEMDRDYGHGAYGGPRAMDSYMNQSYGMESHGGGGGGGGGGTRFGPYESYDSGSSLGGRDLYRSGYGYNEPEQSRFGGSYGGRFDSNYRNSLDSFGAVSSAAPMLVGPSTSSTGRTEALVSRQVSGVLEGNTVDLSFSGNKHFCLLSELLLEVYMGDFGGMHRPGIVVDYHNKPSSAAVAARGIKRKMIQQPYNKPGGTFIKKPKLTKPNVKMNQNKPNPRTPSKNTTEEGNEAEAGDTITDEDFTKDACDGIYQAFEGVKPEVKNEEEEKRRIEARREKQRRRREKNSEKYGDGYRMAFTCSFCKFRTFEEKDIEAHLESAVHQETLDHIQKQTKFDKVVMEFLHECMVNKFKKTAMRKQQTTSQMEAAQITEKDVMEGKWPVNVSLSHISTAILSRGLSLELHITRPNCVTADDHMMKVETVLCSACSVYVPALHSSVQQHLKSPEHTKGKQTYKEQIKRESVLTATSILNNPIVKARYERYVKGENPFEVSDQNPEQQGEEDKANEPAEEEEEEAEAEEEEEAEGEEQTDFTLDQTEDS
ncbi:hypothetical protein EYD10_10208 [Varanus komodoensis]|nr:hypothetical protein EYD10_10208 [Varanus komodoensis]